MISRNNLSKNALIFPTESITFGDLIYAVDKKSKELSSDLVFLKANPTVEFITQFLATIKKNIPSAIFPADINEDDFNNKKSFLTSNKIHPNTSVILFTSGSSGEAKAVQLSKENIDANTNAVIKGLDFENIENQVLFLPLSYSFGLLGQILPALKLGKTTHYVDNIIKVGTILNNSKIEMISGVPSQHHVLTKILKNSESITHVISAGAPLSNELRATMIDKYSNAVIYNNYGQTELSPRALISKSTDKGFLQGSTGKPVDGLTCKITADGELLFKGKQVMLGYVKDIPKKIIDGWLYTGDLAVEKDEMIYVKGRLDSLVKVAGQRISLKFLENIIEELDSVDFSGLIAKDNSLYGNELFVFYSGTASEDKVLNQFKLKSGLKVIPKKIVKLEEFPMSSNGKKDYKSLNSLI